MLARKRPVTGPDKVGADETFGPVSGGCPEQPCRALGRRRRPRRPRFGSEPEATSVSLSVIALAYLVVLVAELPDKTMFASLMLGTRFAARWVFLGAAAAFVVHVVIAGTAG